MGAPRNLRSQILYLRQQGKSYAEISSILSCSKSTINYHLSETGKEKSRTRKTKWRKSGKGCLAKKVSAFLNTSAEKRSKYRKRSRKTRMASRDLFRNKVKLFKKRDKGGYAKKVKVKTPFNVKDVVKKIGPNPHCYLTGRKVDLKDSSSFNLDHFVPVSKGGSKALEPLGRAYPKANTAKSDMSVNEFVRLCAEVVKWRGKKLGYKVIKSRRKP